MRLIDADPLIEEIASIYGFSISSVRCSLVGSVIANAPTINIPHSDDWEKYSDKLWKNAYERGKADRPQGEWKHLKGDEWLCSNCGYVVWTEGSWEHPLERGKDYCEHCGAKMKGVDDE